jgi:hypothetical protein
MYAASDCRPSAAKVSKPDYARPCREQTEAAGATEFEREAA